MRPLEIPGWQLGLYRGPTALCYFRDGVRVVSTDLLRGDVRHQDGLPTMADREGWVILAPGARNPMTGQRNAAQVVEAEGRPLVFQSARDATRHAEQAGWTSEPVH